MALERTFKSFDGFQIKFEEAATGQFGSGWAWLVMEKDNTLKICGLPNQDTPITEGTPLLGIDVWEHAYYLKYQNKRAEYIKAWWNVVDWEAVEMLYQTNNG